MATKTQAAPAKKASKKPVSKLKSLVKQLEKKGVPTIHQIRKLHNRRYSNQALIAAGFNKNTVYRQVREAELAKA